MKREKRELQELLGRFCKQYRIEQLGLSLKQLSEDSGVPYKTLYSFEIGLSSNLYMFYIYYNRSLDKQHFLENLIKIIEGE